MTEIVDLTLPLRLTGRVRKPVRMEPLRELTVADLALLEQGRGYKGAPPLKKLRDSHHRVARLLAAGKSIGEVCAYTGYSRGRIDQLKVDPTFKDLIEVYRKEGSDQFNTYTDMAMENMVRGERLVADSLEAAGDRETALELSELRPVLDIVSQRQDRFGYPAQAVNHNVNHDLAGALEKARKRSGLALPAKEEPRRDEP